MSERSHDAIAAGRTRASAPALHAQRRLRTGRARAAGARARRGPVRVRHAAAAATSTRSRACSARRSATPTAARWREVAGDAAAAAGLQHELGHRASAEHRARRAPGRPRPRRHRARVLHLGRLGGGRGGVEARPPVPPRPRRGPAHAGDRPPQRLPRRDARRAVVHRRARLQGAVRPPGDRRRARLQHEPLPPRHLRRAAHRASCCARSSRRSSPRAPRRSRCSSPSRCRTPGAASCRPRATGPGCARSATATGSCSWPTR